MATIGVLGVAVRANTKNFQKGMKRATKRMDAFIKKGKVLAIRAAKIGAVFAGAAAAGITFMIKKQLLAIDTAAKLSRTIDITTERLQGLRLAAEISGSSAENMDKALLKMSRGLGEAKQGLGTAKEGLEVLGISIDDIIDKSPDKQIAIIADEINKLGTTAEKNAVAAQLFGRAGQELINTFAEGSRGLEKFHREADKLGIAFSNIDAAQVEAANDAMLRLGKLFDGIFTQLTIKVAPFIEATTRKLVEMGTAGEGVSMKLVNAFDFILRSIAKMSDLLSLAESGWLKFASVIQQGSAFILSSLVPVIESIESMLELLGIETTGKTSGLLKQIDILEKAAKKSAEESRKAWDDFLNETAQGDVRNFVQQIKDEAKKAAEDAEKRARRGARGGAAGLGGRGVGVGREINLSRTAVAGISGIKPAQEIKSKQIDETNRILKSINKKVGKQQKAKAS